MLRGEGRQEEGKLVCFSCDSNKAECNMTALGYAIASVPALSVMSVGTCTVVVG